MLDFLMVSHRPTKKGPVEIYPRFIIKKSEDLMIRGRDFYAVWVEEDGLWSTDEQDALRLIDLELDAWTEQHRSEFEKSGFYVLHMWDASSGMIDSWHKYCQKQMRDSFHMLDSQLTFSNTTVTKRDHISKRLPYALERGETPAYERLMSTLYSPEERHKIEWAIGSIVSGDSQRIQKFLVLYGEGGTGKSTVLNIVQKLFEGYYATFDAKALGSSSNAFALEAFRTNPLVAIQHDGDLSHIEDNTRLNSLVSHELMMVNEKFKSTYSSRFRCFLFMGTNKPVKITDGRSGLIRRLIDVTPTGEKLKLQEYQSVVGQINFELGAIAAHCKEVYEENPSYYDAYVPINMLGASNDFYNFVLDSYTVFNKEDGTTLKAAWEMYKAYCEDAQVAYPVPRRVFKEELKNYFREYKDRLNDADGLRVRSCYAGFRKEKFEQAEISESISEKAVPDWLKMADTHSIFDEACAQCPAQYASEDGKPLHKWVNVSSTLSDLDTTKLHYVKVPENHIVIDFDISDENGKSPQKNLEAAAKWPKTYAELSKSGAGIHLHYIYDGDVTKLSRIFDDQVEVKISTGDSSLRRKLTKCNSVPISKITAGLPMKGEKKLVNFDGLKTERALRTVIKKNLNKEYHGATKPSMDFIKKALDDAYEQGLHYDVSDLRNDIFMFAANSTNQADYCIKLMDRMHFKSDEPSDNIEPGEKAPIVFFDVEVFPNLFVVCYKARGQNAPIVGLINPSPTEIEALTSLRLVGFNNRRYDNHLLYGCLLGYNPEQLYSVSQRIIKGDQGAFFSEAYNLSYTDVYDFSSKKQSLKKFEIELGIHHQELGLPWDKPVPENLWKKVVEYCKNDVMATEAVFEARSADFAARQILANLANGTPNDTTNSLSARIIFGGNRKPQDQFNYRDLGAVPNDPKDIVPGTLGDPAYTIFDRQGRPVFPGYKYEFGKSTYRGEEVGEGGLVRAKPGMYVDVALLDIASMHPSTIIAEELFGPLYTKRFRDIRDARIAIKHHDFASAKNMLDGALTDYISELENETAWFTAEDLAQALKIVINSIYGLTAAGFENPFRDPRNKDNIVAKRGALFMVNLMHEVEERGFVVAHIKTDSIKIPNATPEIIQFVTDYGKQYGYIFEHEATYERMCLVNDAVYIARYKDGKHAGEWTATGTQFQVPYVFKKLFTKEPICFGDMCETKSVSTALYLDMNEGLPDVSALETERLVRKQGKGVRFTSLSNVTDEELSKRIESGHCRHFVGKVGQFCPIKAGCGGGILLRETIDKKSGETGYAAATGSKGYRWMESEMVKTLGKEEDIDRSYYDRLADEAVEAIAKYGDFEWFVADDKADPWDAASDPWKDAELFDKR